MTSILRSTLAGPVLAFVAASAIAQSPQPGLRVFSHLGERETHLVDEQGNLVHTWFHTDIPGTGVYVDADGTLLRTYWTGTPYPIQGAGGGIRRFAFDGTLLWDFQYDGGGTISHHDIAILPNGNVLMLAWEEKSQAEAIAAGRNPVLLQPGPFRPDHIIEVQPTPPSGGNIVWEWHVWDHLIQDLDSTKANYGVVADHPEKIDINHPPLPPPGGDFNHLNGIDYDPVNDWIVVSARSQNEIWIIDHSTTTAEAAGSTGGNHGKGGDLIYRWGNPAAYGRGTLADAYFVGQHASNFVPQGYPGAGNVLVFNNGAVNPGTSKVDEIVLPLDANGHFIDPPPGVPYGPSAPVWTYSAPDFGSSFVSSAERLPNGNTLVCSGGQGWLFEITPAGQRVWEYQAPTGVMFHTHFVDRTLWHDATELSLSAGGTVRFDIVTGANHASETYLLVGSSSGTSPGMPVGGHTLPLNFDGWMVTTVNSMNAFPFANSARPLDANGRGTATFTIPGGVLPPGLVGTHLDHAFVIFDPTSSIHRVSNAVGFTFTP